jgi:hypothetical protein
MKKLLPLLVFILLFSCTEKDQQVTPNETNYFPLAIGNYWVYEHYKIDVEGNETKLLKTDSITITKDTLVESKKYFILEGTNSHNNGNWTRINLIKSFAGEIINLEGNIIFSETNFTDILSEDTKLLEEDTLYILSYKMEKTENKITVPSGTFDVLNYKGFLTLYYKSADVITKIQRNYNTYYSENVGKILETYMYYSQPDVYYEKRLVRYKIN